VSAELDALIHEAADWLRIPSISAGAPNEAALREAATWAQRRVLGELHEDLGAGLARGA